MRIKKFIGATLQEAVAQMKRELGKDAMVLQSKTVPGKGLFDYSGQEQVEILAAVDEDRPKTAVQGRTAGRQGGAAVSVPASPSAERREPKEFYVPPVVPPSPESRITARDIELLKAEMKDIRATVGKVADFLRYRNLPALPENLLIILKQLLDNEVDEKIAREIVQDVHVRIKGDEYDDLRLIVNMSIDRIASVIKTAAKRTRTEGRGAVVTVLVGPTGVGKTTTLAKMASTAKLVGGERVALISADTYRIGAVEQLRTFAGIADIPLQVVYSPAEMEQAVSRFKHVDRIFIDTTGRGQRDKTNLEEMAKMTQAAQADEVHLVLSATTKYRDMEEIIANFRCMGFNRMLFTKLDETTCLGALLNLLIREKKPVSFVTTGQTVPDDIEPVQATRLARMILRRKKQ